jgi:trk system potassium uptake protein TrkH
MALFVLSVKPLERGDLRPKEGFLLVSLVWILVPLFGCLPYVLSGAIPSSTDAYFESLLGFTTTGASILVDVESFPRGSSSGGQ